MAKVLGIDLGSYAIKIAELDMRFRTLAMDNLTTHEVTPAPGRLLDSSLASLPRLEGDDAISCVALPGDRALLRTFEIPFSDPKKVEAVISGELADDIPWELDELVFDYLMARQRHHVLVAAAQNAEVRALIDAMHERGYEPRHLPVGPAAYAGVARRAYPDETVFVVDLGHRRTNVCMIVDGQPAYARTISRGGHQITDAIRRAFQLSYAEAERFKHENGNVALNDESDSGDEAQHVARVTAQALAPLVREIGSSLAVASATVRESPPKVVICGGTAQLSGIREHLASRLGCAVELLNLQTDPDLALAGMTAETSAAFVLAVSTGMEYGRRNSLDLRRGEFAFKSDRSLMRDNLSWFVGAAVAVLLSVTIGSLMSLKALSDEQATLQKQLGQESRRALGVTISEPQRISKLLRKGARLKTGSVLPGRTAVDVLDMISRAVPDKETVKLDMQRLDIKSGKAQIRGTAESSAAIGKIAKSLRGVSCFGEVSTGKISSVAEGKKQFSLTIETKCF